VTTRPPHQQRACALRWGPPLYHTKCASPIGVVRPVHRGGGGFILQMRPWLGFRRGAGGQVQVRMNEHAVCGSEDVLICSLKECVATGR
jgi:hypothetical protein